MTRQEALNRVRAVSLSMPDKVSAAEPLVDMLIALDVLVVEPSGSPLEVLAMALQKAVHTGSGCLTAARVVGFLRENGYEVQKL
jgi:hypothetical protein